MPEGSHLSVTAAAPIEDAIAGSEAALSELIVLYQKRVAGFVLGLTGEPGAVEDPTQAVSSLTS